MRQRAVTRVDLLNALSILSSDATSILVHARTDADVRSAITVARSAYRRLVKELHPDRTGNDADKTAAFRRITEARELLDCIGERDLVLFVAPRSTTRTIVYQPHPDATRVTIVVTINGVTLDDLISDVKFGPASV